MEDGETAPGRERIGDGTSRIVTSGGAGNVLEDSVELRHVACQYGGSESHLGLDDGKL